MQVEKSAQPPYHILDPVSILVFFHAGGAAARPQRRGVCRCWLPVTDERRSVRLGLRDLPARLQALRQRDERPEAGRAVRRRFRPGAAVILCINNSIFLIAAALKHLVSGS